LIVYLMWNSSFFTKADLLKELNKRNLPTEKVNESLETLQTYMILNRGMNNYYFSFQKFRKMVEKIRDINDLLEEEMKEVEDGNF